MKSILTGENYKKTQKGITLIALVVTIIVLLILAGVSIMMLTGQNGILRRAEEAKEKTQLATEDEQMKMAMFEATMNTENTEFQGVTIPAGFAPTGIDGESTVDEGLVITDSEGNEFVWVPCYVDGGKKIEGKNYPKYSRHYYVGEKLGTNGNFIDEAGWRSTYDVLNKDWADPDEMQANSVSKYGGFWIGRYEAGIPESASFYNQYEKNTNLGRNGDQNSNKNVKPISKSGYFSWNYINWECAKEVSENMYMGSNSVESYLIDHYAWDTTLDWFAMKEENKSYITNSVNKGNYRNTTLQHKGKYAQHLWFKDSNGVSVFLIAKKYKNGTVKYEHEILKYSDVSSEDYTTYEKFIGNEEIYTRLEIPTGSNDNFKVNNVYDMAGNLEEWNAETYSSNGKVFRSGTWRKLPE